MWPLGHMANKAQKETMFSMAMLIYCSVLGFYTPSSLLKDAFLKLNDPTPSATLLPVSNFILIKQLSDIKLVFQAQSLLGKRRADQSRNNVHTLGSDYLLE